MLFRIYYYIVATFLKIFCRIRVFGAENIPVGRAIICGNHTSMMDPLLVAIAMYDKGRHTSKFMAKMELSRIPVLSALLKPLIIFVDRGKSDMKAIKDTIGILKNDEKIIIFPEGRRVEVGENARAKTGVAMMSLKTESPLVPVYITEGKKHLLRFPRIDVIFGKSYVPVKEKGLSSSAAYQRIVDDLMDRIRSLKKGCLRETV
jgi:1-acyl-sn-glycerol-3-phosphate acyltransferase